MKQKLFNKKALVILSIVIGLIVISFALQARCSGRPEQLNIESAAYVESLYPWPGAKIPFACHVMAFFKSPLAPSMISADVFKEDGFRVLGGHERTGVLVANISVTGELYRQFPQDPKLGKIPPLADNVSLYVDDEKLQIGYIGFKEFDREFSFATILNPFLLPGNHVGKITILLPSGETLQYQWQFEITWW